MFLLRPQCFQLLSESCFFILFLPIKQSSSDDVVSKQQDDRAYHADDQALGGLHEHGDVPHTPETLLINPDKVLCRNDGFIGYVVGVTFGLPCQLAVVICRHFRDAVSHHAGAVARRIEERNDVAGFNIACLCRMTDDQIAGLDLRIHGVGQDDERESPADAGHIIAFGEAFDDQRAVYDQDRDEDDAEDDAYYGPHPVHC